MRLVMTVIAATLVSATLAAAQVNIGFGGVVYNSEQPIEVTSDSLRVDQSSGNAVFSGNVVVVQGNMRLAAGEVQVIYGTGETRDVQRVLATGGVLITRGNDAAEGQRAEYRVSTGTMVLTGDVLVTQGPSAIAGDRLSINLNTGDGTVDGRVRTVLQTDEAGQ